MAKLTSIHVILFAILPSFQYLLYNIGWAFIFNKTGTAPWKAFIPVLNWYYVVKLSGINQPWWKNTLLGYPPNTFFGIQFYILDGFNLTDPRDNMNSLLTILLLQWYLIYAGLSEQSFVPFGQRNNNITQQFNATRTHRRFTEI